MPLSVKCNCCGLTQTDDGTGGPAPFRTWIVSVTPSTPPARPILLELCDTCRPLLISGDYADLAARVGTEH